MSGNDFDQDVDPINIEDHDPYVCRDETSTCPYTCTGLSNCTSCGCAVQYSASGPWGSAMDVIVVDGVSVFISHMGPIVYVLTTARHIV